MHRTSSPHLAAHASATSLAPRLPLAAMAALVLCTLVGVAAVRLAGISPVQMADAPPLQTRPLNFEDRADGSIAILDARDGRELDRVAPGSNGFLRSAMRGLARERKRQGLGAEAPFLLIARADGRLTLHDPATERRIDLESFGPTNAAAFAHLLVPTPAPSAELKP